MTIKQVVKIGGVVTTVAAAIAASGLPRGVEICSQGADTQKCTFYSADDFKTRKRELGTKVRANTPLSYEEYSETVSILDYTIKQRGGITFTNVTSSEALRSLLIDQLK